MPATPPPYIAHAEHCPCGGGYRLPRYTAPPGSRLALARRRRPPAATRRGWVGSGGGSDWLGGIGLFPAHAGAAGAAAAE